MWYYNSYTGVYSTEAPKYNGGVNSTLNPPMEPKKKKVRDMTLTELNNFCNKHKPIGGNYVDCHCPDCPFYHLGEILTDCCNNPTSDFRMRESMDKEIEL